MVFQEGFRVLFLALLTIVFSIPVFAQTEKPEKSRIEAALVNITTLVRPGRIRNFLERQQVCSVRADA